jgi:tetratricopeptide (TPR) repeat protein
MASKEEFVKQAELLYEDWGSRRRLLRLLSDETLMAYNDARLYRLKGMLLRDGSGRQSASRREALRAFNKALQLDDKDVSTYRERGIAWRNWGEQSQSLQDFDTALTLDPRDSRVYVSKAVTLHRFKHYREAKIAFTAAIHLKPEDPIAYLHRSFLWNSLRKTTEEIKDLARAMRIVKTNDVHLFARTLHCTPGCAVDALVRLGHLYFSKQDYRSAFVQYNRAVRMYPDVTLDPIDFSLVNSYKALASLPERQKRKIFKACIPISHLLRSIRESTEVDYEEGTVVHFTRLPVADILLHSETNLFRYYHVAHMNDPEEGNILLQMLDDDRIEEAFASGRLNEETNFYIGSFLPGSHADELVMWRTYGRDEHGQEAGGCSIVIDRTFFYEFPESTTPDAPGRSQAEGDPSTEETIPATRDDRTLRRVLYFDRAQKRIQGEKGDAIWKKLRALRKMLTMLISVHKTANPEGREVPINRAIDSIVYFMLTELRYLFKSSDYAFENEERIVRFVRPESELVKIDEAGALPKRLYVEAQHPIRQYIKQIILGPRVEHPERWYYLKVMAYKGRQRMDITKSKCKFQ